MTTKEEEEGNTELISLALLGSKNFRNRNRNRIKFTNSNVIFRHCKHIMPINYNSITLILLIFFISITHFNCQTYDGQQKSDGHQDSEFLLVKSKTKRSTNEDESQSSRQQQSFPIPAANPNFEAAFQGECGKNNNSNPCEHICLDLHDGTYECSCFYGFALAVDGYSCASLDKSALSTTSSSITSTTLLPTKKQLNKPAEGDLKKEEEENKPILNPYKVESLPLELSSQVEISERRGLNFSNHNERGNNNTTKADRNTSHSSSGFTEIDQTRFVGGQQPQQRQQQLLLKLQAQATEHGRVSDSRKLAAELTKGANLKDNEIANQVGGENKKSEADYSEVKAKVGGVSEVDISASKRRRQRRLLNTAATWIRRKVAAHSTINNPNSDSNYSNNISSRNDDGNNYNDSSPPNEEPYLVRAQQQQNTSYQLSEERPVPSKVAKEADIAEASNTKQELELRTATTTRATITESEGMMATSDTVAGYNNNNNDNNNNNKGKYTNNWPKYELDADQNPNLHQFIKFSASKEHENDNISDNNNYNEYDDLLVDEDIKSIMISNDKLVKHLADLVSFMDQTIDSGDNEETEDDNGDEEEEEEEEEEDNDKQDNTRLTIPDKTMGKSVTTDLDDEQNEDQEQGITLDRRQVAVKNKSRKAGQERKIGGGGDDDDGSSNNELGNDDDERGGVNESLDYNLNLLEDLVRKTFEDYARKSETSFLLDQITKPTTETSTEQSTSYQINRTTSTEPNRSSSLATENGYRARRSSKLRRRFTVRPVNRPTTTEQFDVGSVSGERIRSEEDDDINERGLSNRMRDEEGGSYQRGGDNHPLKNNNQNKELPFDTSTAQSDSERVGVPELSDTQNSIKENINDRLCIGEIDNNDNNNNNDNFHYKNCSNMPECESGGKCITETKWFIPHPNQNFDLEYLTRPRCQCPIGRGGYLCQKPIQRKVPRFSGKSYLALPMIKDSSLSNLHFLFKPFGHSNLDKEETSLLLYSEKFLLLLDDLSRVELRYITQESGNKITRVIGSRDAEINRWNELLITNDASSDDLSQIETNLILPEITMMNRIVLVLPDKIQLLEQQQQKQNYRATTTTTNKTTHSMELFVAGVPDAFRTYKGAIKRQHSPLTMDKENLGGFSGCIRELSINKQAYNFRSDLNGDTLDGFDIGECCKEN